MERDEAIRQIWSEYHDSASGRTRWKEMAERLTEMGVKTSTGKDFNKDSLWTYVKRHKPVNVTVASRRAGKKPEAVTATAPQDTTTVEKEEPLPPEAVPREATPQEVKRTAHGGNSATPEPQLIKSFPSQVEVANTAIGGKPEISPRQIGTFWFTADDEIGYALILGQRDCITVVELLEWFRNQQRAEAPKALPEPFPEAIPSYDDKAKTSLELRLHRVEEALKLAKRIWPDQRPSKSNLLTWLVERFIAQAEAAAGDPGDQSDAKKSTEDA